MTGYQHLIREIPNFPKQGILYRDITPLLLDPDGFAWAIDGMTELIADIAIDTVVAIEARGYLFGAPIARALGAALVPVRKAGKLPYRTHSVEYDLEYGSATLEIHQDAIQPGQRVLLVDDLLATSGSLKAVEDLVTKAGGQVVAAVVLIELADLDGRNSLGAYPIHALISL